MKIFIDTANVDEIREANLLTQEDVANMICESQQTIAKYKWTASTIENFCKVFKCEPCEIVLSDENEMKKFSCFCENGYMFSFFHIGI